MGAGGSSGGVGGTSLVMNVAYMLNINHKFEHCNAYLNE